MTATRPLIISYSSGFEPRISPLVSAGETAYQPSLSVSTCLEAEICLESSRLTITRIMTYGPRPFPTWLAKVLF